MLCQYKDSLGIPGQGVHSYRILNIAIVDVILTIIGALLFSWILGTNFWITLIVLFLLGIFLHKIF